MNGFNLFQTLSTCCLMEALSRLQCIHRTQLALVPTYWEEKRCHWQGHITYERDAGEAGFYIHNFQFVSQKKLHLASEQLRLTSRRKPVIQSWVWNNIQVNKSCLGDLFLSFLFVLLFPSCELCNWMRDISARRFRHQACLCIFARTAVQLVWITETLNKGEWWDGVTITLSETV